MSRPTQMKNAGHSRTKHVADIGSANDMESTGAFSIITQVRIAFTSADLCTIAVILLLSIFSAILEFCVIGLMYPFMNYVMDSAASSSHILDFIRAALGYPSDRLFMIILALLIAGLYILKSAYSIFFLWLKNRSIVRMRSSLSARMLACLLRKPWTYHLSKSTADSMRMVTAVDSMFKLVDATIMLASTAISAMAILAVLCLTDLKLTCLVAFLVAATLGITHLFIADTVVRSGKAKWSAIKSSQNVLLQTLSGVKGIYISKRQQHFVNRYADACRDSADADAKASTVGSVPRALTEAICMAGVFVYMAVLAVRGVNIAVLMPTFATFALAAVRLIPLANAVNDQSNIVRFHRVATYNVCQTIRENEDELQKLAPLSDERGIPKPDPLREGVFAQDITFRYPGAEPLYEGASIAIPAGSSVAFVGKTGAGKTTMADIILGLHRPENGTVLADGKDISLDPVWWSEQIGYIPQSIFLSNGSIRENVAFGFRSEAIDDDKVWACLADAQLKDFVEALPQGLDTKVGENGIRLSGGQRQRLGVARALYTDPSFIVLDEATSSLDAETEQALVDAINGLSGRKTLLTIAHRLSTIENCDIVYRFTGKGVVVERGADKVQALL